ncbi:SigE family RNA polymerase sigma factor [Dactylosporangium sp. AC04546]|uniref:SigE family RNA polymerase sigma factor n=1 Tax=Dactylosporangium sp. AC04546 TaxID=2862460 RepID=UPI001EDE98BB|nr:SigE family RNA polymerase sigma factor [Dactylosporangium sp. AC04546]WVK79620.1 SigE family RNA polymerase sigma factor [Dactylosporangium sp. AC04546]
MNDEEHDFEVFYRARTPALLRTAYLLTGDRHLAEDLVQDALARTHRSWRKLRDGGNPEAYARQVMYHLQVSRWRRKRVAESLPGELPEPHDGRDHAGAAADRLALRKALLALPTRQRAALVLRYFEDCTEAEAAELLGCRIGTLKSHTARGLAALRKALPDIALEGANQ